MTPNIKALSPAALALALLIPAGMLQAQVPNAPSRLTSASGAGNYEMLLIKNRGRYFGGRVSPSGVLHLYLDDSDLQLAQLSGDVLGLSPRVADPNVRKVSLALVSRVPQTLRLDQRPGQELGIGVVRLPGDSVQHRRIEVESVIDLVAPLRIHGRGAPEAERLVSGDSFFRGAGRSDR